jgi:hypothetical protein
MRAIEPWQGAAPEPFDLALELAEVVLPPRRDHEVRPRAGEGAGQELPEAPARPGDDGDAAVQVEERRLVRRGRAHGRNTTFIRPGSRA